MTVAGTPVGVQVAWLSINNTGTPPANTRVALVVNCAMRQGPFDPLGGGFGQPATTYCVGSVVAGWPVSSTRGFGEVGVACPPCEH